MKKAHVVLISILCFFCFHGTLSHAQSNDAKAGAGSWPTHGWAKDQPANVGLDEKVLTAFDSDLANGKYALVDSFAVYRCGKLVFERKYFHDYGQIYGKEAKTRGPLNARLTGPYNYFDPAWHPYYHGTDLHSMQSVSKTVSSIIVGIAITRGDFKAGLDTPLLKYFDVAKVKNVDDRKRRITLRHVLTMTTGLDWNEEVAVRRSQKRFEPDGSHRRLGAVRDRPPDGSGAREESSTTAAASRSYWRISFEKETGQDIEKYGAKYLFTPLGIEYYWKRTPLGVVDTEGGLFLKNSDLAKIGYLYLNDGMWDGQQIVSKDWVKQSLAPFIDAEEGFKYGFKWWLMPRPGRQGYIWMGRGFGGQRLMVFPEEDMIAVFTGWEILKDPAGDSDLVSRILPAVRAPKCGADPR